MNNLDVVIKDYLEMPQTDYAIMISGEWGCGKTYYLHHDLNDTVKGVNVPSSEDDEKKGGKRGKKEEKKIHQRTIV